MGGDNHDADYLTISTIMKKPEIPTNEAVRHQSLCELAILDTAAEARFDRITRVAQRHFNVPIALVSLVDSERQWFKSRQGLDASETPRDISFCGHAILADDIFYIANTLEDPRFADNPLVMGGPKIRFYAGAPLHAPDGQRIGTLCIIDDKPRTFSQDELTVLRDLADAVEAELERGHLLLAEKALADNEARIRAIVDMVLDGIITIDSRGRVQTFNPAAERIFGYAATEVVGHNVNMLMPAPYVEEHDSYLQNYLATGDKKVIGIGREVTGQRKDGSTFPMELAVSEMKVNGDRMFTGIVRDITERKRIESNLRSSENRMRAVIDTVVDGIITIKDTGMIQTANPATASIFGYDIDEMLGHNVNMLMPEPYHNAHDGYLHNYLTTGDKKVIGIGREVTGLRKDGSTFPMELAVSEMEVNGERMFTGIVRDITERKRLDLLKSEFVSTVSHELRTPLTSIRGALGLVLGKSAESLPNSVRQMLKMAERNSERLTLLINDILDLEKIESGRLEFELAELDLVALARRAVEDSEGYAHQHQVQLCLQTNLTTAPVRGDTHRLLQVFANLISNAVKYSPQDGTVEILVTSNDGGFRVAVCDHGPGIPAAFRSRIFQRFAQADSSDTREKGGTGLGLSISQAIIERHEGRIGYQSEEGEGTVFHFDLPAVEAVIKEGAGNERCIRVLICEDNADVASILAEMLKPEGMVSDIAATAEAARTLLAKHAYRLLLLDLTLPDADGLQFLRELRSVAATVDLPVIVVSGRAEEGRIAFNGDAMAVVDWLQKPLELERLERALHEVLRHNYRPCILHVEDDPDIIQITQVLLEETAELSHVATVRGAREMLAAQNFDLVILDLGLADGSGLELLDELKGGCPVVIFSAQIPDREITEQVTAALTKSMTSNEQLLETINKILRG